ncbi:GreA/GreB family elongation factor [Streptomyces sp. NPDC091267]|uniref:GreA/GreB family elongation factor n=1 Tax=Streptomyces sp. NPDC091267 TaxID=3155195 RepID=UPI00342EB13F
MTGGPEPISAAAREGFERELADLRAERETVAGTLMDGEEAGGRGDEVDELQRAETLGRLDRRIAEINGRRREASVAGAPSVGTVGVGSSVTVRFADATESTLQIGEVAEWHDRNMVTADSPLGRALLGRRAGDTVTYETPEGPDAAVVLSLGDPGDKS